MPTGTTVNGSAFGTAYGGQLSDWVNVGTAPVVLTEPGVAPAITSGTTATSIVGTPFNYTVTTTGSPTPAITETGALPTGLTFVDNGNGTATISGTPAAGTGGSYTITITATNTVDGVAQGVTQGLTLTNAEAPTITSANTATFSTGVAGTYTSPPPAPRLPASTESGTLPTGLTLHRQRQRHRHHRRHPGQHDGGHLPGDDLGDQRLGQHGHAGADHHG